ncbi:MAG: ParB/RepB/Spo0J family partition protein [Bacillota bacterium]
MEALRNQQIRLSDIDVVSNVRKQFDADKAAELEASVRAHGVLQPVLVSIEGSGRYRLVAGERRVRAARAVGLEGIPAMVAQMTEAEVVECQVVENLQREDVSAIEEAQGFRQLTETCGYTQQKVADKIGVSQAQVANRLRLLRLPAAVQEKVIARQITAGHAMALLRLLPDGKTKPGLLFDEALEGMAGGRITVAEAQKRVDEMIWQRGRSLKKVDPKRISEWSAPFEACFDVDADCLANPKSGRCPYVVEANNPWEKKAKAELRCVNPKCWDAKQDKAYRSIQANLRGAKASAEKERKAAQGSKVEKKPPAIPAPKTPPAQPLENVDIRVVQRLGKAAWAAEEDLSKWGDFEFRRECYLPIEALLKHFEERAKLGASNMPATLEHAFVQLVGEGVTFESSSGSAAQFEIDGKFRFTSGAYNNLTIEDDFVTGYPVYYCAESRWDRSGNMIQRLAIALSRGRILVIVASDSVMMRRELRPKWYNLLQVLPASPVSCAPEKEPTEDEDADDANDQEAPAEAAMPEFRAPKKVLCSSCDGDCEHCPNEDEDDEEGPETQDDLLAGDSVTQAGYQGPDGRVFIVDDGLAQGEEWGVFEAKPNGSLRRVKSFPMTPDPERAEEALEAWAERKRMTPVFVTRSDDSVATRPRPVEEADSPALLKARKSILDLRPDDEQADKPLACKDCGLRPCGPDTKKLCRGEAAG